MVFFCYYKIKTALFNPSFIKNFHNTLLSLVAELHLFLGVYTEHRLQQQYFRHGHFGRRSLSWPTLQHRFRFWFWRRRGREPKGQRLWLLSGLRPKYVTFLGQFRAQVRKRNAGP